MFGILSALITVAKAEYYPFNRDGNYQTSTFENCVIENILKPQTDLLDTACYQHHEVNKSLLLGGLLLLGCLATVIIGVLACRSRRTSGYISISSLESASNDVVNSSNSKQDIKMSC